MEIMTLEQMYYIGELIAAVAVIITLIFLTIQVRQNTRQMEIHGLQEALAKFIDTHSLATVDAANAKNFRMGLNDFNALSRNEKAIFHSKLHRILSGFSQALTLHMNGLLGHAEFIAMEESFLRIISCPGTQQWWEQFKHIPPENFTSYIDKRIQEENRNIKPFSEDLDWYKSD